MSTSCGWCSRAGYNECFCGYERPQYDDRDDIITEQAEEITKLEEEMGRRTQILMCLWNLISRDPKLYKEAREATAGIYTKEDKHEHVR